MKRRVVDKPNLQMPAMGARGLRLPEAFWRVSKHAGVRAGQYVLAVCVATQTVILFQRVGWRDFKARKRFLASTSRFGVGQKLNSNQTPLGLHRIAEKIGGGWPVGAVFRSRQMAGYTWQSQPRAPIAHRILWLEGLESGRNRGGDVDTHSRYIYIHGLGDEPSLGRPASHGCIHLAAQDLLPLFDLAASGTLVWIAERL